MTDIHDTHDIHEQGHDSVGSGGAELGDQWYYGTVHGTVCNKDLNVTCDEMRRDASVTTWQCLEQ